jgi:MoaA/NifB/PqqE/SkfB family radical SAM enzyme
MQIKPQTVRVDASTICQLKCPSCPTAAGDIDKSIGSGFLKLQDFSALIDRNNFIKRVELTNWGEIFLNPEMLPIMQFAFERQIDLLAVNGVNLNSVKPEVLEGLVKYGFRAITVSIDGATPKTYETYRVNGTLKSVLANVERINEFKRRYDSPFPKLYWQFVVFGHNEHEIELARSMARERDMIFLPKLNWEDLYNRPFSAVKDKELVRTVLGAADREEFQVKNQRHFCSNVCQELWTSPQINFDGEVLGCPVNYWQSFGNAFKEELIDIVNGERMNYARQMVAGKVEAREDIPCSSCKVYAQMKKYGHWVRDPLAADESKKIDPTEALRMRIMQARGFGTF